MVSVLAKKSKCPLAGKKYPFVIKVSFMRCGIDEWVLSMRLTGWTAVEGSLERHEIYLGVRIVLKQNRGGHHSPLLHKN
jgi:hypothetical protein